MPADPEGPTAAGAAPPGPGGDHAAVHADAVSEASAPQRELDATALKAYAHPLRMRIIRYLGDHGAATSTELARVLGESTGQTSYHLRQLARHGLIEDVPGRGSGRERWWCPTSFSVDAARMRRDPATAPAAALLLSDMVEGRSQALQAWVSSSASPEWASASVHDQRTLILTPAELAELVADVHAALERFTAISHGRRESGEAPDGAERVRLYLDAFPLTDPPD
ncbi:winged helix-turn-helix domain-containing protein [Georgenia faecalis]|uniref:Winged helix-turn-helix domain-containing protein n=1 Tax=Georgenia faecalis TaxID=2483799 RepID=A0ABV9D6T9_9MICO|nr:helix-turn-helix domain-containing protein [Georgenia faecalis]